jgi:hypothetical protein
MRCEAYVRGRLGKQEPSGNAFHFATVRVPRSSPLHARSRSARAATHQIGPKKKMCPQFHVQLALELKIKAEEYISPTASNQIFLDENGSVPAPFHSEK